MSVVLLFVSLVGGVPRDAGAFAAPAHAVARINSDLTGTVTDSTRNQPLPGADVIVLQAGRTITRTNTDAFGHYVIHNLSQGTFDIEARYIGYHPGRATVTMAPGGEAVVKDFQLGAAPLQLQTLEVQAPVPVAIDTRTGNQVFKQDEYHGAPSTTTSQILQQSIVGAARAPTGEVHIRGQHAEYTYYIDGVPVPAGVSGSLNELFDPAVVNQIEFQTGGWDAEYGNKNAAVVNVSTKIPAGKFHADASSYYGSFKSNGQSLNLSTNASSKLGFFFSGSRQVTDMRREPLVLDPATGNVFNFHNHGEDLFGFGKIQYLPSAHDIVNLDVNWSRTRFGVPYDSTGGVFLDDHQQDKNSFENLGWRHQSGNANGRGSDLFASVFHRNGSLGYTPGTSDDPSFVFFPDPTLYNLSEDRSFNTTGVKIDYTARMSEHAQIKFGTLSSITRGHEDFVTTDANGNPGPASNSDLKGSDIGFYGQTSLAPSEKVEIRAGLRYDTHDAPFAARQSQLSPRIRVSLFPDAANTIWLYYGRQFMPTNVEDLRAITSGALGGDVTATPTLPERDHFFELGYVHRFPFGVVARFSAYHKSSSPGIDDNTVPGSAITTSVNIEQVKINGIETVLEIRPGGPMTGYLNVAVNHAYGHGPITGGFFPTDNPQGFFDLDHDQRISAVANLNYAPGRLFLSTSGIYGSGLTNGQDPDASYGTGLFAMNKSIKVDPNFILNASAGYSLVVGSAALRPQVFVDNIFNKKYLLKGAFFSGPSVGRPRSVQFRLNAAF